MPQVPYNPVADVSPSGQGTPYFSDRGASPEAFGAGVGASEEKFGQQLERTASVVESNVLAAQQLKNEADVNAATTSYIQQSGDLTNGFRQLPGSQAQEQLPDHMKSLQTTRETLRDTLTSPAAKKMFDQETMHRFALDTVNSSLYAAQQSKLHLKQTYDDKKATIIQDAAANADSPGVIAKAAKAIADIDRQSGKLDDANPDAINKSIRTSMTTLTSSVASALSKKDPEKAQKILDEGKKANVIDSTKVEQIQATIDEHKIQYHAMLDAAQITSDNIQQDPVTFSRNPEGTLIKMRQDAATKADQLYPNDPILREKYLTQLESNIAGKVNTEKKAQADRTNDLKATVTGLADQTVPSTGRKPISIQEMNALNPQAQQYYDEAVRRDPNFAATFNSKLRTNNKEDNIIPPDKIAAQKNIWAGKQPNEKMATNPADLFEKGVIDSATRDMMYSDQNKIRSQATNSIHADTIIGRHTGVLNESGIYASRTDAGANERYQWFRGALVNELQRIQGTTGTPVKGPQEDQVVNDLLRQVSSGKKGWFGGDVQKPKYEVMSGDQPDWVKSKFRDAVKDPQSGKWRVYRDGKLFDVNPPKEGE